ncbi:MAG: hypothetical protein AB7Q17_04960 [Phycisphaerae bacterium]
MALKLQVVPPPIVTNHAGFKAVLKCPQRRFRLRAAAWVGVVAAACVWALAAACFCCLAGASPALAADPFWAQAYAATGDDRQREPTIGVSATTIIQATNFGIAAYTRTGTLLWRASLDPHLGPVSDYFWEGLDEPPPPPPEDLIGDARVLYDPFSGRFVVTALRFSQRKFYLAVSHDDTPSTFDTEWDTFYLDGRPGGTSGIIDWPGLATSESGIFLSTLMTSTTPRFHVQILERPPVDAPANWYDTGARHRRLALPDGVYDTPSDSKHWLPMPAQFLESTGNDRMYFVQTLGVRPENTRLRIRTVVAGTVEATFDGFNGLPPIDDIDAGMLYQACPETTNFNNGKYNPQNVVYRNGRLYFARMDIRAGSLPGRWVAHWYVVNLNGWPAGGTPTLEHDGIVDGGHVFTTHEKQDYAVQLIFPYVMPTSSGGVALYFTRFHRLGYFDLCWTAHRPSDPPHIMGAPVTVMTAGEAGMASLFKYGDYEGIAFDPIDGDRVWATGETGRCVMDLDVPCPSCAVGWYGTSKATSIGSYTIPTDAPQVLTIQRATGTQPDELFVKDSPADIYADSDVTVTAAAPSAARTFGHGMGVTLLAPEFDGWEFDAWVLTPGGTIPANRLVTITLNTNTTATPRYTQ